MAVGGLVSDQSTKIDTTDQRSHADRIKAMVGHEFEMDHIAECGLSGQGLVLVLPLARPMPSAKSPFCALSMAMNLHDGRVDHGIFHVLLVQAGTVPSSEHMHR